LPFGTTVNLATTNGTVDSTASFTIVNTRNSIVINATMSGDGTSDTGTLEILVTTPNSNITSLTRTVND